MAPIEPNEDFRSDAIAAGQKAAQLLLRMMETGRCDPSRADTYISILEIAAGVELIKSHPKAFGIPVPDYGPVCPTCGRERLKPAG